MSDIHNSSRLTVAFLLLAITLAVPPLAAQSIRFLDVTDFAGISVGGPGLGVAVHDYDEDGWDDLFVTAVNAPSSLFRNLGNGAFEDVTASAGIDIRGRYTVPLWADMDNDGRADLYVGGYRSPARLLRNLGGGAFEDVSPNAGLITDEDVGSAALADFDNDGRVDLFVAIDHGPDRLYRNVSTAGDIRFEDVTTPSLAGPPHTVAMQATWFDVDHDGDQDLFVVHDGFDRNRLYLNRGFEGLSESARAAGIADIGAGNSMGIAWSDVDGDGWEDVYVSRLGLAGLYRNLGGGAFSVVGGAAGAEHNGMAWGTVFADMDNDADPDLFVVNESGFDNTPTLLYENRDGHFYDVSVQADASLYVTTQSLASADLNRDGLVDLIFPASDGRIRILQGTTPNAGNWLTIRLHATRSNRSAIGVRVEVDAGGKTLSRYVSGGDSFCSQSSSALHFGLGSATHVDAIRVFWSGGREDNLGLTLVNTELDITEGSTTVSVESDIAPTSIPDSFRPYPNPTSGSFRLPPSDSRAPTVIQVFDILGKQVQKFQRVNEMDHHIFSISGNPPGTYFVRVSSDDTVSVHPLVLLAP